MTDPDKIKQVSSEDVVLTEAGLGYAILVNGTHVGVIEGIPGKLEYIEVEPHWEGKGIARAALHAFVCLSRDHGTPEVTINNAVHPAMAHILETEGLEEQSEAISWKIET